jgi:aspartate/methionine/tyrosine aminotransferase
MIPLPTSPLSGQATTHSLQGHHKLSACHSGAAFGLDSMTLCNRQLDDVGLAVVPGVAFWDDRCIRLPCAVSSATIVDGLEGLQRYMASL